MEYSNERMPLPWYGHNVQQMVNYLLTIDDKQKRTEQAKVVLRVMETLTAQFKSSNEYARRLWDHLHMMADYKLDIDGPYPAPEPEQNRMLSITLPYPDASVQASHYGSLLPKMAEKVAAMPDSPDRLAYALSVANQMKRAYIDWNRGNVTDQVILRDLAILSHGILTFPSDTQLSELAATPQLPRVNKEKNTDPSKRTQHARRKHRRRKGA